MTLWNAEGLKPIGYLVWPLRSLKVRNPFLTLTWPGEWWPDLWWPGARLVPRSQNDPGSWIRMIHDPWFLEILDPIATVLSKDPKDHRSCPETLSLDLIDLGSCPETLSLDLIDLGSCPETLLLDLIDLGSWTECLSLDPVDLGSWAKHLSWYLKDLGFLDNVSYRSPHGCAPFSLCAATFSFTWFSWIIGYDEYYYILPSCTLIFVKNLESRQNISESLQINCKWLARLADSFSNWQC